MSFVSIAEALAVPARKAPQRKSPSIYALYDPRDGGIRYIGVTSRKLSARLELHFEKPTNAAMRAWFGELAQLGKGPRIQLLETVPGQEWEAAERGWIYWCRQRGTLLNVDRGGMARDRSGNPRPFVAGSYQPPVGKVRKVQQVVPHGSLPAGTVTRAEGRPRLVPVAFGVFRRAEIERLAPKPERAVETAHGKNHY